jgi:pyruvate dehydrogenase phosphatase
MANSQVSSSSDVSLTLTPLSSVDLTIDHSAYNPVEVRHVLRRCKNAPRAIATSSVGGINRVAGSLAVTRALGDAYLKTPHLSFSPYKQNTPYISAQPEISSRIIMADKANGTLLDKYIVLASDGLWECVEGEDVLSWIQSYLHEQPKLVGGNTSDNRVLPLKFKRSQHILSPNNAADHIVNRLLREIRKAKNLPSLAALVSIPKGRGRRSKHDDITASVIDITGFVL